MPSAPYYHTARHSTGASGESVFAERMKERGVAITKTADRFAPYDWEGNGFVVETKFRPSAFDNDGHFRYPTAIIDLNKVSGADVIAWHSTEHCLFIPVHQIQGHIERGVPDGHGDRPLQTSDLVHIPVGRLYAGWDELGELLRYYAEAG